MNIPTFTTPLSLPKKIHGLVLLREEWQNAVGNRSLLIAKVSVGLFLADVVKTLELTNDEQKVILGEGLYQEVKAFLDSPSGVD